MHKNYVMEKMKGLKDLLIHEIQDLYSAEEQIIEAMPLMIEKAKDGKLVSALKEHLKITEQQKKRLDEVKQLLSGDTESEGSSEAGNKGFFGGFFGFSNEKQVCRGMQGLIEEGQKVMGEDMDPKVLDAAIIGCAQKIEHYEICGYGTARAYARELELGDVAERLEETLDEEYEADDRLTDLAVGGLNEEAETGNLRRSGRSTAGSRGNGKQAGTANLRRSGTGSGKSASRAKSNGKQSGAAKKSAPKKASTGRSSSKGSLRTNKSKSSGASTRKSSAGNKGKSGSSKGSKSRSR
jgi:ferritin-like metal-binding protein YciE